MTYSRSIRVEFNHCDPAGIVFYPRYFEMTNSVVENFFRDVVGQSYGAMMADGSGVPTARLETTFHLPSRLDDVLEWALTLPRLGQSSVSFHLEATCAGQHRVTVDLVLVWVKGMGKPAPWPADMRLKLQQFMEAA